MSLTWDLPGSRSGVLKRLKSWLVPAERRALAAAFRDDLHSQAYRLHVPSGLLAMVAWLGFAFETDRRLHPEFGDLLYFRLALTAIAALLILVVLLDRFRPGLGWRGRGLGWMYVLVGYIMLATAYFTGRIADDPNYMSGLQIVVMLAVFVPFPRRVLYAMYAVSVVLFVTAVVLYKPNLGSEAGKYSLQNLTIAYALSLVMTYILDSYRFNIFAKHREIVEKSEQVQDQMERVRTLKEQQDGDYFLTANLLQPLVHNGVAGGRISVEFFLEQKKKFAFRSWNSELGGDYLYADHVSFGGERFVVFINGDAMGKSMQGAGGALVLGTVFRSLVTRAETLGAKDAALQSPEAWLADAFNELQKVFVTFDGTMLVSAVLGLLEEKTGMLYYLNAEHPRSVLVRDGSASFLDQKGELLKLGIQGLGGPLLIQTLRLRAGDVLVVGSDGRDDLQVGVDDQGNRMINEDETAFLTLVEQARGDLPALVKALAQSGSFTDDLSLLRIAYDEDGSRVHDGGPNDGDHAELLKRAAALDASGPDLDQVVSRLEEVCALERPPEARLALARLLTLRGDQAALARAAQLCRDCAHEFPEDEGLLYGAALAFKRLFARTRQRADLERSVQFGQRLRWRTRDHGPNLTVLADSYRIMGQLGPAREVLQEALVLKDNAMHKQAQQLAERLPGN